jgi:large subunit ribosomal protein L21
MYAVIKTGGKQYKVAAGDVLAVEKLIAEPGSSVTFSDVLMMGDEKGQTVGTPLVDGATVIAEVLEQGRGEKIIIFKKKRRKNYRRKAGHRQLLTTLRITDVLAKGAKKTAAKKSEAPVEAKTADAAEPADAGDKAAVAEKATPAKKAAPAKKASPEKSATAADKPAAKKPAAKIPAAKKPAAKKADDDKSED